MFGKPQLKLKTASNEAYKHGALAIDKVIVPAVQSIIDKANEELRKRGIVVAADINWMISEIAEEKKDEEAQGPGSKS